MPEFKLRLKPYLGLLPLSSGPRVSSVTWLRQHRRSNGKYTQGDHTEDDERSRLRPPLTILWTFGKSALEYQAKLLPKSKVRYKPS